MCGLEYYEMRVLAAFERQAELRSRYKQNPKTGRMEGSYPSGKSGLTKSATGGTIDLSKRKEGYNADSTGEPYIPYDSNGNPYKKAEYYLPPKEYKRVYSNISTWYSSVHENKRISEYSTNKTKYIFEEHGYGEYNVFEKVKK